MVISTLGHLDPSQTAEHREYHFLWLASILNSGYPDLERQVMATRVVRLIGGWFNFDGPGHFPPNWIPLLLGFLFLCEKRGSAEGLTALHILLFRSAYSDFGTMILPVLTPILVPIHLLKSRGLALRIFCGIMAGWFSAQMRVWISIRCFKLLETRSSSRVSPFRIGIPSYGSSPKVGIPLIRWTTSPGAPRSS